MLSISAFQHFSFSPPRPVIRGPWSVVLYPLGTGPKAHEIWHSGYYPVVWTNQRYRMLYFNMGHNDLDFDQKPNKVPSSTFASEPQNRLVLDGLVWLGAGKN
jgi:hypothetical protein